MSIVENGHYEHAKFGRVVITDISDGIVTMERHAGGRETQPLPDFGEDSDPADVTVEAGAATLDLDATEVNDE